MSEQGPGAVYATPPPSGMRARAWLIPAVVLVALVGMFGAVIVIAGNTGDSGAPAYDGEGPLVIGIVSWSTAPGDEAGCGGLTGLTPLLSYRDWIVETARRLNSPIEP